jgi:hypothetical protein
MSNKYEAEQPNPGDRAPEAQKVREVLQRLGAFMEKLRKEKAEHVTVVNDKRVGITAFGKELIDGRGITILSSDQPYEEEGKKIMVRWINLRAYRRIDGLPPEIHEFSFNTSDLELSFLDKTNERHEGLKSKDRIWQKVREGIAADEMGINAASRENLEELEEILDLIGI